MTDRVDLIASDLDGTLFGTDHRLSARTIAAVRSAHDNGIRVVAATGRSSTSAVPRLRSAGVITTAICSNGSLIHDLESDTTIDRFPIDPDHVDRFFGTLTGIDPRYSFCWETDHGNGWDDAFADIAFAHEDLGDVAGLDHRPTAEHRTTKIMVRHPDHTQEALRDVLVPLIPDPLTVSCSGVQFVEVTAAGVNKSSGLQVVCERWSIDPASVVAFGDNHNDVEMLAWAGRGVAVSNASASAKAVADEVIGHHATDSVAAHIESIVAAQPPHMMRRTA